MEDEKQFVKLVIIVSAVTILVMIITGLSVYCVKQHRFNELQALKIQQQKIEAEREDKRRKIAAGWEVFEGNFVSPEVKTSTINARKKREKDAIEQNKKAKIEEEKERIKSEEDKMWELAVFSPYEIYYCFSRNEVEAEAQFDNKWMVVKGRIEDIKTDIMGTPYITFKRSTEHFMWVQCMFDKSETSRLFDLRKDQEVAIYTQYKGKMGGIIFHRSKIIDVDKCSGDKVKLPKP